MINDNMIDRVLLTNQLREACQSKHPPEEFGRLLWCNIRDSGGLRLTDTGENLLRSVIKLEHYDIDCDPKMFTASNLIRLDRLVTCPYHLSRKRTQGHIRLFGSREASLALLYGDIDRWLKGIEP